MKGFWDFYAVIYDVLDSFPPYQRLQKKVIDRLDLIPYLRIADCGCGTGNTITRILSERKWKTEMVGFEKSGAMLRRAEKKIAQNKDIKFVGGNFEEVSVFGKKKYDRIVSVNSLYAVDDPSVVLKNWFSVLEDGGLAVVANPFIPKMLFFNEFFGNVWKYRDIKGLSAFLFRLPIWALLTVINLYIARKAKGKRFHFLKPPNLRALAEKAGFKVISEELVYGDGVVLFSFQKNTNTRIRRVYTQEELSRCFEIRYNVYGDGGIMSLPSEKYPEGKEFDRFDEYAAHFGFFESGKIVGIARLIPDFGGGFLLEENENFSVPDFVSERREITLEISRMSVLPEYRGKNRVYQILEYATKWSKERGYSQWIAACQPKIWEGFKKNNWTISLWAPYDNTYHNTNSAPGILIPPLEI